MNKIKFFKLREFLPPVFICIFLLFLLCFSKSNISSTKSGMALWINSIVPCLFPFLVATELLSQTFVIPLLGKIFNFIMRPIFRVPGECSFAFIMGIISGFPVGAKVTSDLYKNGICSVVEAERLLAFTSNSGPLFIVGTIGFAFFGDSRTGILLLITHILACITVGIMFRFWKAEKEPKSNKHYKSNSTIQINQKNKLCLSNLGEILSHSIINAVNTLLIVGGFVVLSSVLISVLNQCHFIPFFSNALSYFLRALGFNSMYSDGLITGLIELTNGIKIVSCIQIKTISQGVIIASFLLGFSGLSVLLQVYSIISEVGLSIKPYIIGKVLQAIFAALYTSLFLNVGTFFNLDII